MSAQKLTLDDFVKRDTVELNLQPYRSGGFINRSPDMGRLYIDLPIDEAQQLFNLINKLVNKQTPIKGLATSTREV